METKLPLVSQLQAQGRIISAIMLQDMRTRFGRSYAGYLIAIAWPLSHIGVVIGGYLLVTTLSPVGDDPAIFLASGVLPYILCLYPARMMAMTILQNRQLLNLPILRPIHLITARLILELLTAVMVAIIFYLTLAIIGYQIEPTNMATAVQAIAGTLYFAAGIGVFNVVMTALLGPFVIVAFTVIMVGIYITSGVYVPVWMTPEPARSWMMYNPLLHLVEWMRSAYFSSYDASLVDKKLVLGTASVFLLLGLAGERFLRNKLLT